MLVALLISQLLNRPVVTLQEFLNNIKPSSGLRPLKSNIHDPYNDSYNILVVDDTSCNGTSIQSIKNELSRFGNKHKFTYFAPYVTSRASTIADIYIRIIDGLRLFQWNYINHGLNNVSCFDLDGVLCLDPPYSEVNEYSEYLKYITSAIPYRFTGFEINTIITSRLEKHRTITENWLKNNNIIYKNLIMLDDTASNRIKYKLAPDHKAKHYSACKDCILFYESDRNQAMQIALNTKKYVFCTATDELFKF